MKKYLPIFVTLGFVIVGITYLYTHEEQLAIMQQLQWMDVLWVFLLMLAFFLNVGYTFKLSVNLLTIRLNWIETFGLSFMTTFGNYLGPMSPGSSVMKPVYLKSIKNLSYTNYAAILAATIFIFGFMDGFTGLILLFLKSDATIPLILWLLCLGLIVGSSLPFAVPVPTMSKQGKIANLLKATVEGFSIIRTSKHKLVIICLTIVVQHIIGGMMTQVLYQGLHVPLSFLDAIMLRVFISMANLFTITPNNIGIQEVVTGFLFSAIGLDFATGVLGAGVARAIHVAITFLFTPVFMLLMLKKAGITVSDLSGSNPDKIMSG
ncbi:MAG: lysylphosphatidylglycerol synthase transmembrane domain-containing protein [Gemmatimonadota bacterium]|nr:lysylphosphatidylglycerol synthase transmembrane domain-containing protein [Gemmatimonadota bacterium]